MSLRFVLEPDVVGRICEREREKERLRADLDSIINVYPRRLQ